MTEDPCPAGVFILETSSYALSLRYMHPKPLHIAIAIVILIIAGAVLWFVLNREVPPTVVLPGAQQQQVVDGRIQEEGTYYEIDATYPSSAGIRTTAGARADAEAVALMQSFAEKEVARFKDVNEVENPDPEVIKYIPGFGTDRKFAYGMEYETAQSAVSVSFIFLMYEDVGGAHPSAYYRTFTFDKESGEALHIDDLFVAQSDFEAELSEQSRAILVPQIAQASQIPVADLDRTTLDAGTTPFIDNFGNFYLEGEFLVIVFPPYQVGPWALGTQEARIPRSQLSGVLEARYR